MMNAPYVTPAYNPVRDAVGEVFDPRAVMASPTVVDTPSLYTGVIDGQPDVFEPVFEYRTIFHKADTPPRRFIGWERVRLRWMRPGPSGKLVPR